MQLFGRRNREISQDEKLSAEEQSHDNLPHMAEIKDKQSELFIAQHEGYDYGDLDHELLEKQLAWLEIDIRHSPDVEGGVLAALHRGWNERAGHLDAVYNASDAYSSHDPEASVRRLMDNTRRSLLFSGKFTSKSIRLLRLLEALPRSQDQERLDDPCGIRTMFMVRSAVVSKHKSNLKTATQGIMDKTPLEHQLHEANIKGRLERIQEIVQASHSERYSDAAVRESVRLSLAIVVDSIYLWQLEIQGIEDAFDLGDADYMLSEVSMPRPGLPKAIYAWQSEAAQIYG